MKSSKLFITSLLAAAAMSAVPAWAENYTVTGAVKQKDNNSPTILAPNTGGSITNSSGSTVATVTVTSSDTFTFNGVSGFLSGWNNGTFAGNIVLSADSEGTSAFVWSDGSSTGNTTITFSGSLSGSGTFEKNTSSNNKRQCFKFIGDVSEFSGNFKLAAAEANNPGILTFGAGGAAGTGTYENGNAKSVSGTGQINWAGQSVVFNYNNTNAATVGNSSITTKTLTFSGGANYTVSSTVTGSDSTASNNTLTISAGRQNSPVSTTFTNTVSNFGTISVGSNATGKISSAYTNSGTLTKTGAGTLVFGNSARISNLTISDGIVQINNATGNTGENKRLTSVTIANEKALQVFNGSALSEATTIDSLTVSGASATVRIGTTEDNGGNSHQGRILIKDIAAGTGTLNLELKANTTARSIFELGESGVDSTGAFTGTIAFSGTNNGSNRSGSLVISNGAVASNAEISLASTASSGAILSLGVNASSVTIGGLSSTLGTTKAKVYSGAIELASGYNADYGDSATSTGTTRSLVIDAAEGKNFSFNGEILANLNLEKDGAGTQTLAGASSAFNGSVTVAGGVLKLTNAAALGAGTSGDVLVKSGATLARAVDGTLSFGGTFTTESSAVLDLGNVAASAAAISATGDVTIADGTVFNLASLEDGAILAASSSGTLTKSGGVSVFLNGVAVGSRTGVSVNESNQLVLSNTKLTLTWAGTESDSWTVGGGVWKDTNETFQTGDNVVFDGDATVSAGDGIVATDISVTSGSVSLSGGSVSAAGALTVSSGASLTVNEGVLGVVSGGISLEANSTLKLVGAAIHGMTNVVSGEGKVVLDKGSVISTEPTISVANVLRGAISVEKIGNMKVSITAAQNYTGGTTITAGNIGVGHNEALGSGTITLNGSNAQMTSHAAGLNFDNVVTIGENGGIVHTQAYTMTLSGAVSGTGTLTKDGTGTLVLSNAGTSVDIAWAAGNLTLTGASANIVSTGSDTTSAGTLLLNGATAGTLTISGNAVISTLESKFTSTINIGTGSGDKKVVSVGRFDVGDYGDNTGVEKDPNALNIKSDAVLKITGSTDSTTYDSCSLLLGEWNSKTVLNLEGKLLAAGAKLNVGDIGAKLNVKSGAVLAVKGIGIASVKSNKTQAIALNISDNGTLILGESGIGTDVTKAWSSSLGAGTIGTSSSTGTTIETSLTLTSATGTTFDTQLWNFASDGNDIARSADTASSITVNGVISGDGALKKAGAGTLTLNGDNTFSGGVTIEQGVLVAGHANALGRTAGTTTVNSGGVLKVAVDGGVTAGTVTLNEGALFAIDLTIMTVAEDTALTIISSSAISFNSISAGDMNSNEIEAYFSASNSNLGGWTDYLRTWSYDAGRGLQLTLTIPEPSMFGLLAGLGALALAGTRRRRKKA